MVLPVGTGPLRSCLFDYNNKSLAGNTTKPLSNATLKHSRRDADGATFWCGNAPGKTATGRAVDR